VSLTTLSVQQHICAANCMAKYIHPNIAVGIKT